MPSHLTLVATDLTPFKKHSDQFLMNSIVKPQKNGQRKWFIMTVFCLHCPTHQICCSGRSKMFQNFIITLLKHQLISHMFFRSQLKLCMVVCFSCEKVSNIGFVFVAFSPTNSGDVILLFSSLDEMIEYTIK